jgi:hypothetical protein
MRHLHKLGSDLQPSGAKNLGTTLLVPISVYPSIWAPHTAQAESN